MRMLAPVWASRFSAEEAALLQRPIKPIKSTTVPASRASTCTEPVLLFNRCKSTIPPL